MPAAARTLSLALSAALVLALVLAGCTPTGSDSLTVDTEATVPFPTVQTYPGVRVIEDVDFGAGVPGITLDVCLPEADARPAATGTDPSSPRPRAAVLSVHGGSWRQGDKSNINWRSVCEWLASEGFVAFSLNYRLAPAHPFPAGISDVRTAVEWLRAPAQATRYAIDPARIGAFGGSAGGNLVSLLGLEGRGDLSSGSRVAAVVDLSGPVDLTTQGFALGGVSPEFRTLQLEYLGCASYTDCDQARAASPLYFVDASDPPFFVGNSLGDRVPVEQAGALVSRLRAVGIPTDFVTVVGSRHSIAMLDDDMRGRIATWLRDRLLD